MMKYKLDTDYINKLKQKTAEQGIVFNTQKRQLQQMKICLYQYLIKLWKN